MQIINIPFDHISSFSKSDVAYLLEDARLSPFYKYSPSIESLKQVIKDKKGAENNRSILTEVLIAQ